MIKKLILLISLIVISSQFIAKADVVSLEGNFVAGQANVVTKLNNDRNALANSVNNIRGCQSGSSQASGGQIKNATICEANLFADGSPRIYLADLFIKNTDGNNGIVSTGLEFQTSNNLVSSATPGTAYTMGFRNNVTGSTSRTFTASRWTYTFICQDGSFSYLERAIGINITTADYPVNCQPLSRVSSDTTGINNVKDLRKTKFTLESYDSVFDDSLESTSKNLFTAQGNSYRMGAVVTYVGASTYTVTGGSAMINSEARDRASFTTDSSWPVASASNQDGLDVGTRGNGTYYVYLVADENQTRNYRVVQSLSATAPSGKTNYLKIGEFYTSGGTISKDTVISYINTQSTFGNQGQVARVWINFPSGSNTINDSFGVTSLTRNAVGDYTVTWSTAFLTANYACAGMALNPEFVGYNNTPFSKTITAARYYTGASTTNAATDANPTEIVCFGRQ